MSIDYKQKYQDLKRKLKKLVYENECFQEELKLSQKRLLKVSREKNYLLDELLKYETVGSSNDESSGSDADDTKNYRNIQNAFSVLNKTNKRLSTKKRKVSTSKQQYTVDSDQICSQKEIERRLELKPFINLALPSQRPPDDIFNDDCSDISLANTSQQDDDSNLIIDMGP